MVVAPRTMTKWCCVSAAHALEACGAKDDTRAALAPEGLCPVGGVADGVAALEVVEPALDALQAAPHGHVHAEGHHHHDRHQQQCAPAAVPPAHVASSAGFFHVLTPLCALRLLHVTCPFPRRAARYVPTTSMRYQRAQRKSRPDAYRKVDRGGQMAPKSRRTDQHREAGVRQLLGS
jgi:hypothetical protein